ncbi:hypothetical protein [Rhodobacter sp. SY28-1]|uniref:hypothetical protein n=1 Tax=Rhodobacter sp. SY28-1 TaxID=2562317 RepID=UPI0010C05731|nr:hypothetical protein [Rhodobacter sp. SY28-1]
MRHLILPLLILGLALPALTPAEAGDCGSIVASVCDQGSTNASTGAKTVSVKPSTTTYVIGDRFPYETRSLLIDPRRYSLKLSDGTWRYYAMEGAVYRVQNETGVVLEVIRNRRTAHLR